MLTFFEDKIVANMVSRCPPRAPCFVKNPPNSTHSCIVGPWEQVKVGFWYIWGIWTGRLKDFKSKILDIEKSFEIGSSMRIQGTQLILTHPKA